MMTTIYDFSEEEVSGQPIDLADFKGQVLLVVNTASKCGLAPQLEQLEALYQQYHQAGFTVIGLPSNQFNQELDSDQAATEYCQLHFGVTFPMTKRVWVNGEQADPLFTYLKKETTGEEISWNYTKFLIGKNGEILGRYEPKTTPEEFKADIAEAVQNS